MIVQIGTAAQAELRQAVDYYERERPGLGREFLAAIFATVNQIDEWPLAGRIVQAGFRARVVRRFPYWLIYTPYSSSVWVTAVAHQSRDPDYWRNRWQAREPVAAYQRLAA